MANVLNRLKRLGLYNPQRPDADSKEFGYNILKELPPVKVSQVQANVEPIGPKDCQLDKIVKQQQPDDFFK